MPDRTEACEYWLAITAARVSVSAVTEWIVAKGQITCHEKEVLDTIIAEDAPIRGNRPLESKPSWSDARLCLMATLSRCLEILEEEESP